MTAGANQHFIPKFVQKPFGSLPKRKEIWVFEKDASPVQRAIKRVASENCFYSAVEGTVLPTLDDHITDIEVMLSRQLNDIRSLPYGAEVEPARAAEVVFHLTQRTAHFRSIVRDGQLQLAAMTSALVADTTWFENAVLTRMASQLGMPIELMKRLIANSGPERLRAIVSDLQLATRLAMLGIRDNAAELARDAHNDSVSAFAPTARFEFLNVLKWLVLAPPNDHAILPDCVAVAFLSGGLSEPYMVSDQARTCAVLMPLSPSKLLVGHRQDSVFCGNYDFNAEAARASYNFFLAASNDAECSRVHPLVGQCAAIVDAAAGVAYQNVYAGYPVEK